MSLKFRGVDFIGFDELLTGDEILVRDTARKFIEDNLIPIIEECNRAGRFPRCKAAKNLAASASPNPTSAQTPAA